MIELGPYSFQFFDLEVIFFFLFFFTYSTVIDQRNYAIVLLGWKDGIHVQKAYLHSSAVNV